VAPLDSRLPGALAEVNRIARIHGPAATVMAGAGATEQRFRDLAGDYGLVHIASFGVLNRHNPMFSFVELARAGNDDGRLETHEVFTLRLAADLVILSACQTGLAAGARVDVPNGDDWVGLVRAFLFAGADRVLGSLWAVDDGGTAVFMTRLHEQLAAGVAPSAAVAAVQRRMIREPGMTDPYLWAAFAVSGR
jgi:CHAT domain-containing protein